MNKGLEVIEARWLFDTTADRIEVVIHPQSIIHSMVEFQDGSIIAQLSDTDMRAAIGFALSHPKRIDCGVAGLNFPDIGALTFESPDLDRFPLLKAAYDSLQSDETVAPILLNAADEVAVEFFLRGDIPFGKIAPTVLEAMDDAPSMEITSLEDVIALHEDTCARVRRMLSEGV
jgi:1-deoxy-D-xylulose-5-phosphate reductoisomerase